MRSWGKFIVAAAAPLLLASCLWGPGKFTSELALRKGGAFVLDYRGEILLQLPDDKSGAAATLWRDDMALCEIDGTVTIKGGPPRIVSVNGVDLPVSKERPCTPAEKAKLRADYEKQEAARVATKREESEQMAKVFGLPSSDDESNRRFAANLMKYQGWRSVRYVRKGVFDVDYHFEGRVGQDFVFPLMPESDFIVPFVTIRRRNDGSVFVTAPALTGGAGPLSARAKAMGVPEGTDGPRSRAEGRFTITTDGEILTNNSEDGPVAGPGGRRVHWDVGPGSSKVPELLVRL